MSSGSTQASRSRSAPDSRAEAPRTMPCPACEAMLITRGLPPGKQIRCGRCGHRMRFGKQEKVNTHRLAWRSFWLGLASCVLLFLTGIPAVYYGIRSLLRMRFVRPEPLDRLAAASGTALGGCFGIGVSGLLLLIGGVLGLAILTMDRTEDPAQVRQRWSVYFAAPLPESLKPQMAQTVFRSHHRFRFVDTDRVERRTLGLQFMYQHAMVQFNTGQLIDSLRKANLPERAEEIPRLQQEFRWPINDREELVTKRTLQFNRLVDPEIPDGPAPPDAAQETVTLHQYFAVIPGRQGISMIALVIDPERGGMTEDQIREWFSQVELLEGTPPK